MARRFFDVRHPMFRPLWARILGAGLPLAWAVVEFAQGSPFWGVLFAAAGGWLAWQFFVVFDPADYRRDGGGTGGGGKDGGGDDAGKGGA